MRVILRDRQAIRQRFGRADHRIAQAVVLRAVEEHPGGLNRGLSQIVTGVLIEAGDLAAAELLCTAALASCQEVGDLCAGTGSPAEAVTAWTAMSALSGPWPP